MPLSLEQLMKNTEATRLTVIKWFYFILVLYKTDLKDHVTDKVNSLKKHYFTVVCHEDMNTSSLFVFVQLKMKTASHHYVHSHTNGGDGQAGH